MHVEAGLLYREGEVRARDGEVLEHPGQTAVSFGVVDWIAIIGGKLPFGVDWSWCRLAIRHADTFENVHSVPLLGQVEAIAAALDVDAEEEPELAKVLHGKLSVQAVDDLLKQRCIGAGEHHIIDVDDITSMSKHEQGRVGAGRSEADANHERGETSKPCPRCLMQPVQ